MKKRRDAFSAMLAPIAQRTSNGDRPSRSATKSGSVKAMGLSLATLSKDAGEAHLLREQLIAGNQVVEIDSNVIDPSMVRDRLDDWEAADFGEFQESIRVHGQQVPVLLRPHPESEGRYQIAYGHRRVEALRRIGAPVKALVRQLSDEDLIVAQGKENTERRDLSFIERALFARRLEEHGFQRAAVMAALSVHKGNLSTMISLARELPEELIIAVGAAPKVGRPRWEELSKSVRESNDRWKQAVERIVGTALDSNQRFTRILRELAPRRRRLPREVVRSEDGTLVARVDDKDDDRLKLTIEHRAMPEFGTYLLDKLPEIYASFRRSVVSEPRNRSRKGA